MTKPLFEAGDLSQVLRPQTTIQRRELGVDFNSDT